MGEERKDVLRVVFNRSLKLVKTGAEVITHARYVVFQMAEVAITKCLFDTILKRIWRLRPLVPVPI